jgi:hypothetical protein
MTSKRIVLPLAVLLGVVVVVAVFVIRERRPSSIGATSVEQDQIAPAETAGVPPLREPVKPAAPAAPTVAATPLPAPTAPPRPPAPSEAAIMDKLHALGSSDPVQSLQLAREGNRRFKHTADAPERASLIVKALSSLGRHDEARLEALKMEQDYPHSDWTSDVHRHMFINPPNDPAERGHGKTHEIE